MKIIHKDFKKETKLKVETIDDLWDLKNIISKEDIIGLKTLRTVQGIDEKEKRAVYLKIRVENVEFDESTESLRVSGRIIEGPDDISQGHHSARIEPGDIISIEKEWKNYQVDRLFKSAKAKGFKVLILVIDEKDADFGIATQNDIKFLGSICGPSSGKMYAEDKRKDYYGKIVESLEKYIGLVDRIIVAGPGFAKESVMSLAREKPGLKNLCVLGVSSVTGKTGIQEVINRGELDKIVAESKISLDTKLMETLLGEIGRDKGLATYGLDHVKAAADLGAVDILLVSEKIIHDQKTEDIIRLVESHSGSVYIVGSTYDAGKRLIGLGNIAAVLRYKVE